MSRILEVLVTLAIAAASAWHLGCAVTDYEQGPLEPPLLQSHGLISCHGDGHFANSQQTFEPHTRELHLVEPGAGSTGAWVNWCAPQLTASNQRVTRQEAKEWNRTLAAFSLQTEFTLQGLPGFPSGTWLAAGVKDLPDGSRRINNFWHGLGPRICALDVLSGRAGGPEGVIVADRYLQPGDTEPRTPSLRLDTIAIDSEPGNQWCRNVVAIHPGNVFESDAVWISVPNRAQEWRLQFTPITRRSSANQSRLLAGAPVTVRWKDHDVTVRIELEEDGDFGVELLSVESKTSRYEAKQPLRIAIDPESDFRRMTFDVSERHEELRRFTSFLLEAGFADREIRLGQEIEELAVRLPDIALYVPGTLLETLAFGAWPEEVKR